MVTSDSIYDSCSNSESTEERPYDSEPIVHDLEVEDLPNTSNNEDSDQGEPEEAYANEPLEDAEWLAIYEAKRMEEKTWRKAAKASYWNGRSQYNGKLQRELHH